MDSVLLTEAQWKRKYAKPHYSKWAKVLDGRAHAGGAWKSDKQYGFYSKLSHVQPGSQKDPLTRYLHKMARKYLPNVKPSHRLLITRYVVSPNNKEWFDKADVYEFDKQGLIRKWRVSQIKQSAGSGKNEIPKYQWRRAEVVWKRTGFRDDKSSQKTMPKSGVTPKQIRLVAGRMVRRYNVNTMKPGQLRMSIMRELAKISPIMVDFKRALRYLIGKESRGPDNMKAWREVIDQEIEKVIAAIPNVASVINKASKKKPSYDLPKFGSGTPTYSDDEFEAMYQQHMQQTGAEDPGALAGVKVAAGGYNPYEDKEVEASVVLQGTDVAAIGAVKSEDSRRYWIETRDGHVYAYSAEKGEFDQFRTKLVEMVGDVRAKRSLVRLKEESKKAMRALRE